MVGGEGSLLPRRRASRRRGTSVAAEMGTHNAGAGGFGFEILNFLPFVVPDRLLERPLGHAGPGPIFFFGPGPG